MTVTIKTCKKTLDDVARGRGDTKIVGPFLGFEIEEGEVRSLHSSRSLLLASISSIDTLHI